VPFLPLEQLRNP